MWIGFLAAACVTFGKGKPCAIYFAPTCHICWEIIQNKRFRSKRRIVYHPVSIDFGDRDKAVLQAMVNALLLQAPNERIFLKALRLFHDKEDVWLHNKRVDKIIQLAVQAGFSQAFIQKILNDKAHLKKVIQDTAHEEIEMLPVLTLDSVYVGQNALEAAQRCA